MRKWIPAVLLLASLAGCAGNDGEQAVAKPSTPKVTVKDFVFSPKTITVKKGTTVTWTNQDDFDHSVQIDSIELVGPKFGPQTMPVTYTHRFADAGTYAYICGVHNSMTGTVVVTN